MAAAAEAGVKRFIYCGTLHLFDTYPEDTYITEYHEPFPPPSGERMWRYLGELTVREFVRDHAITGTSLRLGTLVAEDEASLRRSRPQLARPSRRGAGGAHGVGTRFLRYAQLGPALADSPRVRQAAEPALPDPAQDTARVRAHVCRSLGRKRGRGVKRVVFGAMPLVPRDHRRINHRQSRYGRLALKQPCLTWEVVRRRSVMLPMG